MLCRFIHKLTVILIVHKVVLYITVYITKELIDLYAVFESQSTALSFIISISSKRVGHCDFIYFFKLIIIITCKCNCFFLLLVSTRV